MCVTMWQVWMLVTSSIRLSVTSQTPKTGSRPVVNDLRAFGRRVKVLAERFDKNSVRAVKRATTALAFSLIEDTPVDEGDAKSNWRVSSGGFASGIIDAHAPGKKGSTAGANESAAKAAAEAAIAARGRGEALTVSNNLPYIERLNDGWSDQAPAGFIEAAMERALEEGRKVRFLEDTEGAA